MGQISVELQDSWISCVDLEKRLNTVAEITLKDCSEFQVSIPINGKLMVDSGVRLLSYLNQLIDSGKIVTLNFEEGEEGTYGYMSRLGFFDYLDERIITIPERPDITGAEVFKGGNSGVLEIIPIVPNISERDEDLPTYLTNRLLSNFENESQRQSLEQPCFTFFAELIDNIYRHSKSILTGFIAFQVYPKSGSVKVSVSDSGIGLLNSLRPVIAEYYPQYNNASDSELIEIMFSKGISKDGVENGCGLKACANHALKFHATMDIRLPHARFHLTPLDSKIFGFAAKGSISETTLDFAGTHITLDISLDK